MSRPTDSQPPPSAAGDAGSLRRLGRHNPRLAGLRRIARGEAPGVTVIDSPTLVAELSARGVIEVLELYGTADRIAAIGADLAGAHLLSQAPAWLVDGDVLRRIAPTRTTQGLLAVVRVPDRPVGRSGVVVYLDRVQDPGNVGAVVRCVAAFGGTGVACSPGTADPFSPRAIRAAAGACFLLPVETGCAVGSLARELSAAGGEVAAAVGAGGIDASRWRPRTPLLLLLGNEGQGLAEEALVAATTRVTVAVDRAVESLNVAVVAGLLLAGLAGVAPSPILERGVTRGGKG